MNSRKMERTAGGEKPVRTKRAADLLPRRPAPKRLVTAGWNGLGELPDGVEVVDEGPADAVFWAPPAGAVDAGEARRLRDFLEDGGRLVLGTAEDGSAAAVRPWVRLLSETGFTVLQELPAGAVEGIAGPVLVARRDAFTIRSFADGDEPSIDDLFTRTFHVRRSAEHWRWKYHEAPWGNRFISLAHTAGGELACHYSGYPVPLWHGGRELLTLHMGDTMTDARHRDVGRGTTTLLARTVKHFFAVHRERTFSFYYGFNTGPIQRFCLWFIGGSRAEAVCYRHLDLASAPPRHNQGYRVERIGDLSCGRRGAFDRLFRRAAPHYGCLVRRDAEYVDWRYLRCPDPGYVLLGAWHFGELVGWSVFKRHADHAGEERLVWGDALFLPRHARAAGDVLAAAVAQADGVDRVDGWFPDRPRFWDDALDRLGFEVRPEPQELGMVFLPDLVEDPPVGELYYTKGDGDLF